MIESKKKLENEEIEIHLLLEAINMKYGYDFRNYSSAHMKRRIHNRMSVCWDCKCCRDAA